MARAKTDPPKPRNAFAGEAKGLAREPSVYVLSDIRLLRDGLRLFLQETSVLVLGAGDFTTPPAKVVETQPSVLLVDIGNPKGLSHAVQCRDLSPRMKIVALSVADVAEQVVSCAEAGVAGFVPRDGSIEDVTAAICGALREEILVPPRIAATLMGRLAALSGKQARGGGGHALTPREYEIACFVSEGLSNKEIARQLHIQDSTVKNHMHHLLGKLQLRRRGEIARHLRHCHVATPGAD